MRKVKNTGALRASAAGCAGKSHKAGSKTVGRSCRKPSVSSLKRMSCHSCGKFGNWKSENRKDGSLPGNVKSFDS